MGEHGCLNVAYVGLQLEIRAHALLYAVAGIVHRGMCALKQLAYVHDGQFADFLGEIHNNLTRIGYLAFARLGEQCIGFKILI